MYRKRHLAITAVITALAVFVGSTYFYRYFGNYLEGDNVLRAKKIIVDEYVDTLNPEQLTRMDDAAIAAMVRSLGDPYSRYMNMADFEEYQEDSKEDYVGIGVTINFDMQTDIMTVMSPYDNSPAQKAGVLPGDIIKNVDGVPVSADTYHDIIEYIKSGGKAGDSITLTIIREDREMALSMERQEIHIQTITKKMFEEKIGYVRVAQFINSTAQDFKAAIEELKGEGMQSLIIDLRNNPGGYAHTVLDMADYLLPQGTIAYLENNQGERRYFESDANELGLPMAVLINGGSASASELLAGSIQAYGLGKIVGEKSFGKAVGQSNYQLTKSTSIYLTNARYYTPKEICIDQIGITPDEEVKLAEELRSNITLLTLSEDNQLSRAIEILKAG